METKCLMVIKKQSASLVPAWFKVGAYVGLDDLDEIGWYLQFVCRRMLNELTDIEAGEGRKLAKDNFSYKLFEQLCFRPIARLDDIAALDFPLGFLNLTVYAEALWPNSSRLLGVMPTSVSELFKHEALLNRLFGRGRNRTSRRLMVRQRRTNSQSKCLLRGGGGIS